MAKINLLLFYVLITMTSWVSFAENNKGSFEEVRKKFGRFYFHDEKDCPLVIELKDRSIYYSKESPEGFKPGNPIAPEPIFSISIMKEEEVITDPDCRHAFSFVLSSRLGDDKSKTLYETIYCMTKEGMFSPVESQQAFLNGNVKVCPERIKSTFPGEFWKYLIKIKR